MRRDSIFYKLFAQSPALLFELLPDTPANAASYRFDSVGVKEPKFEIDGVFLPPDESGTIYFCEFQFQKVDDLCERLFAELFLYFYYNRDRFSDWQAVLIYPSRSTEQDNLVPYRNLLACDQVHRIYIDELGDIRQQSPWLAVMILTTVKKDAQATTEAKHLIGRAQQEVPQAAGRAIIEMVTTIVSYRFKQRSREEIEAMLDINFEETRAYRDLRRDIQRDVREEVMQEGLQAGRQEGLQAGRQEGRQEEASRLLISILTKRFGEFSETERQAVTALSLSALEELGDAFLDFESLNDLRSWLQKRTPK